MDRNAIAHGRAWACAIAATLAAIVPFAGALPASRTLAWRDTARLHAPLRPLVVDALRHLRLPLWNPYEATGQPLFGQAMHAVLHPVSIAAAWIAPSARIDVLLLGCIALAALGAYLAARSIGASPAAAFGAGMAYGLGGYVVGMTTNLTFLAGAASAPWQVAAMRVAARPGAAGILAAALATAACAFSGDIEAVITSGVIGAALAAEAGGIRAVARSGGAAALGLLLAAIQLVPAWAAYSATVRGAGAMAQFAHQQWALSPWRLMELVFPGLFVGRPHAWQAPVFMALGGPTSVPFPWAPSVFVGAPSILLAGAGAARQRIGRVLGAAALLFLWLALGHRLGATQLLGGVPLWGSFRYAEKLVGPLTLSLALGASIGIDAVATLPPRWLRTASIAAAAVAALIATACVGVPGAVEHAWRAVGAAPEAAALAGAHLGEGAVHALLGVAALAALVALRERVARWVAPALAVILFAESAVAAPFAVHVGDASAQLSAAPPAISSDQPGPRLVTPLVTNVPTGAGGLDAIDRTALLTARRGVPATNARARVDNLSSYTGLPSFRFGIFLGSGPLSWAFGRRLAVTHVVASPPADGEDEATLRAAIEGGAPETQRDGVTAWSVPHRAWASFAPGVRPARSLREAAHALGTAIREGSGDVVLESSTAPPVGAGRVIALRREPERVSIDAEAEGDAVLVVADAYDPGWQATIDGNPVPILPADVLVRAVRWPAGRHHLEMRYDPPEIALGAMLSATGVILLLVVVLITRRQRGSTPLPRRAAPA